MRLGLALLVLVVIAGALACGNARGPGHVLSPETPADGGSADRGQQPRPDTGAPPTTDDGGEPDTGSHVTADGCSDLFTQDRLRRYEVDVSAAVWQQLMADFLAGPPPGDGGKTYYPIDSLRYEGEVRSDATIRLKGDSSWRFTVTMDANPKAQFVIAFDKRGAGKPFHGVDKINFDMPQSDLTFLHERLTYAYYRGAGIPAPCANSAELVINGQSYGLYVSKEHYGGRLIERLFPGQSGGVLLKAGYQIEDNAAAFDQPSYKSFWAAHDVAAMVPIIAMDDSLRTWAAEMMINNYDGYWGGNHNYFVYHHPQRGYLWMTDDADATFDWSARVQHPFYWWIGRSYVPEFIPQHYLAVIADDHWRGEFVERIREVRGRWNVQEIQGWIDAWGPQIADAAARDPHPPFSMSDHRAALGRARAMVASRADFVRRFLDCADSGAGDDADGDGRRWCNDCNDTRADVHPGAPEICGDGVDQDCDSVADDGCAM